ncbi:MAG: hypothetical protein BWX48_00576 [Verrucomicrobia bacterium ADurb.Bin006]|nr:MAG: hypothetical protein BWX48_00576 [Verrucomicrobia bacterium ADurb.Bin006]
MSAEMAARLPAAPWSLDILKTDYGGGQCEAARGESQAAALPTIMG